MIGQFDRYRKLNWTTEQETEKDDVQEEGKLYWMKEGRKEGRESKNRKKGEMNNKYGERKNKKEM